MLSITIIQFKFYLLAPAIYSACLLYLFCASKNMCLHIIFLFQIINSAYKKVNINLAHHPQKN